MMTEGTTGQGQGQGQSQQASAGGIQGVLDTARETATSALETTRDAARRTAETVGENPLALLAGGIALGVLVGVLLPRHAKERELLDPLGRRLAESATAAAQAAREAGKAEIDALIPDKEATQDRLGEVVQKVIGAAKDALQPAQ